MNYLSNYNGYVSTKEGVVVYNTVLYSVIKTEEASIDEVKEFLKSSTDNALFEMGFVRNDLNETKEARYEYNKMKYSTGKLNVTIIMTYDCNCSCEYCFENIDASFLSCKTSSCDIEEVSQYIIGHYYKHSFNEIEVTYFGGEPTLMLNEILEIQNILNKSKIFITTLSN